MESDRNQLPGKTMIAMTLRHRHIVCVSLKSGFLLFLVLLTSVQARELPKGVFDYQEKVGDTITPYQWSVEKHEDGAVVTVIEEGKTFRNYCTRNGATYRWDMTLTGKHDITAVRKGDTLEIAGILFGEDHRETVTIDERPWYQPLSFSLGRFLDSDQQKTSFWIIRADTIEAVALTAEKMGNELLVRDGKTIATSKVEVRAAGFYSSFWSATYWYRKSDNLFLRYESVHGLPGTEETVVELVSSPAGRHDS